MYDSNNNFKINEYTIQCIIFETGFDTKVDFWTNIKIAPWDI